MSHLPWLHLPSDQPVQMFPPVENESQAKKSGLAPRTLLVKRLRLRATVKCKFKAGSWIVFKTWSERCADE